MTTIGGEQSTWHGDKVTNTLLSLLPSEGGKWKWVEHFPPMLTRRQLTAVVCSGKAVVVAGENGGGDKALTTVEVMDADTLQWSTASGLLQPLSELLLPSVGTESTSLGALTNMATQHNQSSLAL